MVAWWKTKPGSAAWLLLHECRLAYYDLGDSKEGHKAARGMSTFGKVLFLLIYLFAHVGMWLLIRKHPILAGDIPVPLLMGAGVAMLVIFSFMLSMGLSRSVSALFERGDLDLLLSSPLSSKTIFIVRLAGITFSVGIWFFLLATPLANVGLLVGQWQWLGIYPALLGLSMLAAALSMLLTLALVRAIGIRKTRSVAQILGALTGASMFILSQTFSHLGKQLQGRVMEQMLPWFQAGGVLDADSPVWLPARALFGSPSAIAVFILLCVFLCWLTVQWTHRFFIRGVQQATGNLRKLVSRGPQAGNGHKGNFGRSLRATVIVKEWRLIARDPQLISQVLLQVLYIAPLFFLIFKSRSVLPAVAAGMVFLAGSLAGSLIWIIVAAEDAPDLLCAAPVRNRQIVGGKLIAAVLPVGMLLAPAMIWMLSQQLTLGLLVIAITLLTMSSSALVHLWLSKPATRSQFKKRGKNHAVAGLVESLSTFSWAACIYVGILFPAWFFVPVAIALLVLGTAWFYRIERNP